MTHPYTCTIVDHLTQSDLDWFYADARQSAADLAAEIAAMQALYLPMVNWLDSASQRQADAHLADAIGWASLRAAG